MKQFLIYPMALAILLAACNSLESKDANETTGSSTSDAPKISKRDRSITPANAYNDLFLDSTAVEAFIAAQQVPDDISRRIRSFYNTRNYQFAWFSSNGLTEQARGFWNLHDYHTSYNHDTVLHDKALQKRMDRLTAEDTLRVSASDKNIVNTELTLTEHFIQYNLSAYDEGYVKRKEMERFVPRKREDALYLADSLLNKKHKDNRYFEDVNASYKALKEELGRYYAIAKNGGWPALDTSIKKPLKRGDSSQQIALIKRRLQLSGDMPAGDTSLIFTDTLEAGVKSVQQRFGYTPDGIIRAALLKEMNVPAVQRLEQILINMDRMRWMPSRPDGNLIIVNIPEFILHVMDGGKNVFDMNVVVGKEGHNTVSFTGDLNQVVFSPYWNVPQSIVEKEILPAMARNSNYLAQQNMEITSYESGLPIVRQLPGPDNSLGRVKFLFPNSFNIYFHDTNAKDLFNKDKRAYSHGCIRLAEPEKLAQYLLRGQTEWTPEKIEEAMNSGEEKTVRLKNPVPVFISYYTAWVDESGRLNFRDDIYKHDEDLRRKMFTPAL
jgi:murein L,D-transpeptidase YcbB/YkuD